MAATLERELPGLDARIDPGIAIDQFPGPAAIIGSARRALVANTYWLNAGLAGPGDNRSLPAGLAAGLLALFHTGRPQHLSLPLPGNRDGVIALDVSCLPCEAGGEAAALVIACDRSASHLVQAALADGREFHRGLVLCSSDTTFEIDQAGRFTYVGPSGFLGYADFELNGREIRGLVCERYRHAGEIVFTSRESVTDAELWFIARNGEEQCFVLSLMPFFGDDGEWGGLRGVGREITGQRTLEAEVRRARRAQQRIDSVLYAMCTEAQPSAMIAVGVAALLESIDVEACIVAHADDGGFDSILAVSEADVSEARPALRLRDDQAILDLYTHICRQSDSALRIGELEHHSVLVAPTRYGGRINGALGCLRERNLHESNGHVAWSDGDRHLVRSIAGQMGVAIAQFDLFERIPGARAR